MNTSIDKPLIIGALLHDIGKFRMRCNNSRSAKDHSTIGAEWARNYIHHSLPTIVPDLIQWHHKKYWDFFHEFNDNLFVYQADNLAAQSEREEKDDAEFDPTAPLTAILSTISIGKETKRKYWPLQPLTGDLIFPEEFRSDLAGNKYYADLWAAFDKEFSTWCKNGCHVNSLLFLLEKYTSFIPSETLWQKYDDEKNPDISLFDHCKSTAAIALCLKRIMEDRFGAITNHTDLELAILNEEEEYFTLVGGDFSGVQKFIYTISSRGALKTLRARSFFLEILCEHIVNQFIHLAELSQVNVIYTGGGRFYILAPNSTKTKQVILKIKKEYNQWLIDQFGGNIILALTHQPFSGKNFKTKEIGEVWHKLGEELNYEKQNKFNPFINDMLQAIEPIEHEASCQICHRDDIKLLTNFTDRAISHICPFCADLWHIGSILSKTKYLVHTTFATDALATLKLFDLTEKKADLLCFYDKYPDPAAERMIYALEHDDLMQIDHPNMHPIKVSRYARKQKDIAHDTHPDSSSIANFEELADQSAGKAYIGLLRMDVDHLGDIFLKCFEGKKTFTRLSSLSRQLSLFFKTYLDQLLEAKNLPMDFSLTDISEKNPRKNGRNAVVVYSGGDDLFLVGPWDEIAEISIDIHNAFSRYCGDNPNITISGGFIFQHHDYPLYKLADLGHEAEKISKDLGRNRLTLFYDPNLKTESFGKTNRMIQTLEWEKITPAVLQPLAEFKSFGKIVEKESKKYFLLEGISQNDIGKLLSIMELWQEKGIMYLPRMAYVLGRAKQNFRDSPLALRLMDEKSFALLRSSLLWIILLSKVKN